MADSPPNSSVKLTPKQELFVAAYIGEARFNASEAARLAGYSEKTAGQKGFELKNIEVVRTRIDELLQAATLTGTEALRELTDVAMRGLHEFIEITRFDKDGNPVAAKMDSSAKMKALELLGKHHQLFSENLNIHGGIEIREYIDIPEETP